MMAIGLVLGIGTVVVALANLPDLDAFPRATATNSSVELAEGEWTVFIEDGFRADLRIVGPDGAEVPLRPSPVSTTYSFSDRSGESIGELVVTTPGVHDVVGEGNGTVAFARPDAVSGILRTLLIVAGGALLGGGLFLAGAVLSLVAVLRR